jgi:hypothetical protein
MLFFKCPAQRVKSMRIRPPVFLLHDNLYISFPTMRQLILDIFTQNFLVNGQFAPVAIEELSHGTVYTNRPTLFGWHVILILLERER